MIGQELQRDAGSAILWKAGQLSGTKIIYFVRIFVLARLLSPADFGLMAVAMVAIDVLVSITNLGMIPALVQQKDAEVNNYHAAWSVGLLRSLGITLLVFFGAPYITVIVGEPQVLNLVRVLAFIPTIDALASIGVAGLTRRLAFRELAIIDMVKTLLNTVTSIALASTIGAWALVAGALLGSLAYTVASYFVAPYVPSLTFDWRAIRPLIRYGRWIFLTSLVAVSGSAMLRVVISRQLGPTELGIYFLAARLAFLPTEIASEVIGGVAFPLFARLQTQREQAAYFFRANLITISALLIPTFALLAAFAPGLVRYVLGTPWQGTELIIQVLVVVGILGLIPDIAVPTFKGLGQPFKVTLLEGVQSLALVIFIYGLTLRFGLLGAPLAWFPAILASLTIAIVFLRRLLPRPFAGLAGLLMAITTASLLGMGASISLYHLIPSFFGFALSVLAGIGSVVALIWFLDHRFSLGIRQALTTVFPQVALMLSNGGQQKGVANQG